jgi:foldase protein PrsA
VAKKYSTDQATKNNGGLLTGLTKQQADPALAAAAFSAPANKLLGPVKGQFGYYVFEVT